MMARVKRSIEELEDNNVLLQWPAAEGELSEDTRD
jgi:hypothetical protein